MSWTEQQIGEARAHWGRVKLASGGGMRQGHPWKWVLIAPRIRAVLIAARSGMPIGLIALASGEDLATVSSLVRIYVPLSNMEPLRPVAEAITERVPMWSERPRRRALTVIPALEMETA